MTKNTRITSNVFRLAVLALAVAGSSNAIAADSIATASGTVIAPIAIDKSADLSFGSFVAGATGGSVTIAAVGGSRTASGDVALSTVGAGASGSVAQFDVTGQGGLTYSIDLTESTLTNGTGGTMSFVAASDIASGTLAGTGTAGAQSFFVGGVLTVGAAQAPGAYSGTVTATVAYN